MLLLPNAALAARRAAVAGDDAPLAPLARSLAGDLDAVLLADPHVPERKARLTRAGGRCPRDGQALDFDPLSPHAHRCPACEGVWTEDVHHEAWLWRYQLWLAERAVHAAALHLLLGRPEYAAFARRVLDEAADAYPRYPNRDNALGPTRPFFSTYLESLWLLSLCVALDLLEAAGPPDALGALGGRVRDRLVAPSRALVASYPEGRSNRQVWHAAARLAAARLLGDAAGVEAAALGPLGIAAALGDGLLPDGSWYEGDNYHQFAHRGLWYGVTMAEQAGHAIAPERLARFDAGFVTPFLVALPDWTLPARRDSQYGVSLRQWRWAEWAELGLARTADPRLARALGLIYADRGRELAPRPHGAPPRGDTGRWRASGESERNEPAVWGLWRADLGWKSLLFALATLPSTVRRDADHPWVAGSVLLPDQGLAVLRLGAQYAALDYGEPGGGHGHADRLNVMYATRDERWLDDPGTGSYVSPTLHWYRSTLAHAAPLVDERSQPRVAGRLVGFDAPVPATGAAAECGAAAEVELAPGLVARRTLVLTSGYLLDVLTWDGPTSHVLDLPFPVEPFDLTRTRPLRTSVTGWQPVVRPGAGGLEDGFDFLTSVEEVAFPSDGLRLVAQAPTGHLCDVLLAASPAATVWRARAPGPPSDPRPRGYHAVRVAGRGGHIVAVWDWAEGLYSVSVDDKGVITLARGVSRDVHEPPGSRYAGRSGNRAWTLRRERDGYPPTEVALALAGGPTRPRGLSRAVVAPAPAVDVVRLDDRPITWELGPAHYRRSEASWDEAGRPTARVTCSAREGRLHLAADVHLGRAPVFVAPGAENPLDNERADVNGDGLQLHLGIPVGDRVEPVGAWLLVPEPPGDGVRVTRTSAPDALADALTAALSASARAATTTDGWTLTCALPLGPLTDAVRRLGVPPSLVLDVLVNEKPAERERRQGQLVLSGAAGEFVYLRGDRHDPARGRRLHLPAEA